MIHADTNFLIGLIYHKDSLHNKSIEIYKLIAKEKGIIKIPEFILIEFFNVVKINIKNKEYRERALAFGKKLAKNKLKYFLFTENEKSFSGYFNKFVRVDAKISFEDFLLGEIGEKSDLVLTFDKKLRKYLTQNNLKSVVQLL